MRLISILICLLTVPAVTQGHTPFNVVAISVPGRVEVPLDTNWKLTRLDLYDAGVRPVLTFQDNETHITLSIILFPNNTGKPNGEACRKDVLDPILRNLESSAIVKNKKLETRVRASGASLAVGSYLITNMSTMLDLPIQQENIFGFFGTAQTCAELHLSKQSYTSADLPEFDEILDHFDFDGDYKPTPKDYSVLGALFYRSAHDYPAASTYYQQALNVLPTSSTRDLSFRRYLTDQLSMSFGIAGDIKRSRKINEQAIKDDSAYPIYYYNLACADAEKHDAAAARVHLQQAFDRRANTLPGETFPDPSKDDSILKLKSNKDFWAFVESLSSQLM